MRPSLDFAEINVIGTGGGYGESLVVHLGNNEWIVIDSCKDPIKKEVLPLQFLKERGVSFTDVKLIICTHWHDDHIQGISELYNLCTEAIFCCAKANDLKKFLKFVCLDYEKIQSAPSNSSTYEFNKCIDILNNRNSDLKFANRDQLLYASKYKNLLLEVYSLSPSDHSLRLFDLKLSELLQDYIQTNRKLINQTPNDQSVVIYLKLGHHNFLLGADLEVSNNLKTGWDDIFTQSQVIKISNKCIYFKIPHHGSKNGFHKDQWKILVEKNPICTLTPWNKNKYLPQKNMITKLKGLADELYITSQSLGKPKAKKRDRWTEKTIKTFNDSITEIKYYKGTITTKIDITNPKTTLITTTSGTAVKL